jgi:hypothetical protein
MADDRSSRAREMADLIRRFVDGAAGQYEWDDFMGIPFSDEWLEQSRIECQTILDALRSGTKSEDKISAALLLIAARLEDGQHYAR